MIRPMRRLAALLTLAALLALAPAAVAQDGNDPFGPLPQPAPEATPVPTATPSLEEQTETDRTLLFAIGGGLLALFLVIGYVITRDAKEHMPEADRAAAAVAAQPREGTAYKQSRQAKAKARAKTKAQRAARRHNR